MGETERPNTYLTLRVMYSSRARSIRAFSARSAVTFLFKMAVAGLRLFISGAVKLYTAGLGERLVAAALLSASLMATSRARAALSSEGKVGRPVCELTTVTSLWSTVARVLSAAVSAGTEAPTKLLAILGRGPLSANVATHSPLVSCVLMPFLSVTCLTPCVGNTPWYMDRGDLGVVDDLIGRRACR